MTILLKTTACDKQGQLHDTCDKPVLNMVLDYCNSCKHYCLPLFLGFVTFWKFVHLSFSMSEKCFQCCIWTATRTSKQLSALKLMASTGICQTKALSTFAADILFLCVDCHVMLAKDKENIVIVSMICKLWTLHSAVMSTIKVIVSYGALEKL